MKAAEALWCRGLPSGQSCSWPENSEKMDWEGFANRELNVQLPNFLFQLWDGY